MKDFVRLLGMSVLGLGLWAGGCGGDDDDRFNSGVDQGKAISDLTPAEQQKFCDSTAKWADSLVSTQAICRISGHSATSVATTDAEARTICQQTYDACLESPPDAGIGDSFECDTAGGAECTATVGEYETCLSDAGGLLKAQFEGIPGCNEARAGAVGIDFEFGDFDPPASCQVLDEKCPSDDF